MKAQAQTPTRLCVSCKHFDGRLSCMRETRINPTDGLVEHHKFYVTAERLNLTHREGYTTDDPCGPSAKHWVQRQASRSILAQWVDVLRSAMRSM
jgi:hypothetical protein